MSIYAHKTALPYKSIQHKPARLCWQQRLSRGLANTARGTEFKLFMLQLFSAVLCRGKTSLKALRINQDTGVEGTKDMTLRSSETLEAPHQVFQGRVPAHCAACSSNKHHIACQSNQESFRESLKYHSPSQSPVNMLQRVAHSAGSVRITVSRGQGPSANLPTVPTHQMTMNKHQL